MIESLTEIQGAKYCRIIIKIGGNMRIRNIIMFIAILSVTLSAFAAGKTLEIIAQETAVEGENLFGAGNYAEAGAKFEDAIAKYSEFVTKNDIPEDKTLIEKWLKNAKSSYQKGKKWEDMIRILNINIERHPKRYDSYKTKAIVYKSKLNNVQAAIDTYSSFDTNIKPYFKARVKIADAYYKELKNYEQALEWYQKANELKLNSAVLNKTAQTFLKLKRNKEAIDVINKYIGTNPSNKEKYKSYFNLGTIYMNDMNDVKNALSNYEKAVSFKFDKNATLFMIENYFQIGNFDKVTKHVNAYLKNYPNNKDVVYYRGLVQYTKAERIKENEPTKAKTLYQNALKDFKLVPLTSSHGSDSKTKIAYIEKLINQL